MLDPPFGPLLAQDLGQPVHGPQIGAQSVMQPLIINAGLSFSIGQSGLALDHTFGESALEADESENVTFQVLGYARSVVQLLMFTINVAHLCTCVTAA